MSNGHGVNQHQEGHVLLSALNGVTQGRLSLQLLKKNVFRIAVEKIVEPMAAAARAVLVRITGSAAPQESASAPVSPAPVKIVEVMDADKAVEPVTPDKPATQESAAAPVSPIAPVIHVETMAAGASAVPVHTDKPAAPQESAPPPVSPNALKNVEWIVAEDTPVEPVQADNNAQPQAAAVEAVEEVEEQRQNVALDVHARR